MKYLLVFLMILFSLSVEAQNHGRSPRWIQWCETDPYTDIEICGWIREHPGQGIGKHKPEQPFSDEVARQMNGWIFYCVQQQKPPYATACEWIRRNPRQRGCLTGPCNGRGKGRTSTISTHFNLTGESNV